MNDCLNALGEMRLWVKREGNMSFEFFALSAARPLHFSACQFFPGIDTGYKTQLYFIVLFELY